MKQRIEPLWLLVFLVAVALPCGAAPVPSAAPEPASAPVFSGGDSDGEWTYGWTLAITTSLGVLVISDGSEDNDTTGYVLLTPAAALLLVFVGPVIWV